MTRPFGALTLRLVAFISPLIEMTSAFNAEASTVTPSRDQMTRFLTLPRRMAVCPLAITELPTWKPPSGLLRSSTIAGLASTGSGTSRGRGAMFAAKTDTGRKITGGGGATDGAAGGSTRVEARGWGGWGAGGWGAGVGGTAATG